MANAAPAVASTIGLKDMVIAKLVIDNDAVHAYATPQLIAGAIDVSITPGTTDPNTQYADDGEYDNIYPDPEVSFKTGLVDLPIAIQKEILNKKMDDHGVLIHTAGDKPAYFAVGFRSEKADGTYRYMWLYKVRAKPVSEEYKTKEGNTITRQTSSVEWTAIKRTHDNRYHIVADEGQNGFTSQMAATFLSNVYEPSFTA